MRGTMTWDGRTHLWAAEMLWGAADHFAFGVLSPLQHRTIDVARGALMLGAQQDSSRDAHSRFVRSQTAVC